MKDTPDISFVIPAKDEEGSIFQLYQKIVSVVGKLGKTCEIIFVDDGSTDRTFELLRGLNAKDRRVKVIKLRGNWGKSTALQVGFDRVKGKIIFTLDADLQDDPYEIPKFLKKIDDGYDLVSGWKRQRHDPFSKTLPSKLGNFAARVFTGIKIHDINCGFKAYRAEVTQNLNLYGELYKYIPVLVEKQNYKVTEIVIRHHPRRLGKSKFGWSRNIKGFLDLLTIIFLTGYLKRPAHFFGTVGLASFSMGFVIGLYITYLRITTGGIQYRHPLLFLGMLLMIIGVQITATGLLAEMFVNLNPKKQVKGVVDKILD